VARNVKRQGYRYEELELGMQAAFEKKVTQAEVVQFGDISGDLNPAHFDEEFARGTRLGERVVHGMLTASLVSAVLGTRLPGPGCLFVSQTTHFKAPVRAGDTVSVQATIVRLDDQRQFAEFETRCSVDQITVLEGSALVWVPSEKEDSS
jgi:3-hydroxybutyryl-CoA dehydratase